MMPSLLMKSTTHVDWEYRRSMSNVTLSIVVAVVAAS